MLVTDRGRNVGVDSPSATTKAGPPTVVSVPEERRSHFGASQPLPLR